MREYQVGGGSARAVVVEKGGGVVEKKPRTLSWDIFSRPFGTGSDTPAVPVSSRISSVECFWYPRPDFRGLSKCDRGGCAPSFSAQVRFGEPGAPVLCFGPCYDMDSRGSWSKPSGISGIEENDRRRFGYWGLPMTPRSVRPLMKNCTARATRSRPMMRTRMRIPDSPMMPRTRLAPFRIR
jgi:hypothetical protein